MARYAVRAIEHQLRFFLRAALLRERASRMETAPRGWIDGTRDVALEHDALAFASRIRHR